MRIQLLLLAFALLVCDFSARVQAQVRALTLSEIRIGMEKESVLSGLRVNYQLVAGPDSITKGYDGYLVASKNSVEEVKGQINFVRGTVTSVSEEIGGPYYNRDTIDLVRNLHRLLTPYARRGSDGRVRVSVHIEFDNLGFPGFGDTGRLSFRVESGRQIHLGFVSPDDPAKSPPYASLSVFRNER